MTNKQSDTNLTTSPRSVLDSSVSELIRGIRARQISVEEIVVEYQGAAKKWAHLNAFLTQSDEEDLRAQARAMDAKPLDHRGPLLGVPLALKDNILTKGLRTTAASRMLENFIPPYDATVASRLKAADALLLGKTNLDEFSMGSSNENSAFGPVKNPWDTSRVPGGTSGGSAAAVAARLTPAALGTDTGGSVRQPASFCGVLGLKPTYGRISRYGIVAYASSLDQVGILAQTTEDLSLLLSIIAGKDPLDATSSDKPVPALVSANGQSGIEDPIRGLRIGIPKEYFIDGLDNEIATSTMQVVEHLQARGAKVVDISLPHTEAAVAAYYIIAPAEASSNLSRYDGVRYGYRAPEATTLKEVYHKSRTSGFGEEVKRRILIGTYVLSSGYYDAFYKKAQQVRSLIAGDFTKAFAEHCDVIITPIAPTTAFKIGEKTSDPLTMYLGDIFTVPVSLAGLPALSVPAGESSTGLPIGTQIIAPHFSEEKLFAISSALEATLNWRSRRPQHHQAN